VKARKGELDLAEIRRASGQELAGWLEYNSPRLEWVEVYYQELREAVANGGAPQEENHDARG
jgi:hypothetical protein